MSRVERIAVLLTGSDELLSEEEKREVIARGQLSFSVRFEKTQGDDLVFAGTFFGYVPNRFSSSYLYEMMQAPQDGVDEFATLIARSVKDTEIDGIREHFVENVAPLVTPILKLRLSHDKEALGRVFDDVVSKMKRGDFSAVKTEKNHLCFVVSVSGWKRFFENTE